MSSRPVLASTREALLDALAPTRRSGAPVVLVPTMGALHEGHASLMRLARERAGEAGAVVASVFVNPLQFGPGEDLDRYPRTLPDDLEVCAAEGVDVVFAPSVEEVYPGSRGPVMAAPRVTVHPGPLGDRLEGASRPGHFAGVLTVVAKLFGLVRPDVAVFGEKDYQQLVLVRRMATDLCLGVEVVGGTTRRDPDGLALSSRNRYLDAGERTVALALNRALLAAREAARDGAGPAEEAARSVLAEAGRDLAVDYLVVADEALEPLPSAPPAGTPGRVLVAARVGGTRLIDNMPLELGATGAGQGRTATAAGTAQGRSS